MPFSPKIVRLILVAPLVLCLVFIGCGGEPRPDGLPPLHPTVVQFTQGGEPIEGASVQLVSETDGRWPVGGATDASGSVTLQTYGRYPGVPEGRYKVLVLKTERERVGPEPQSMFEPRIENVYDLVDPIYSTPETTPLTVEVQSGRNSLGPFDLGERIRRPARQPGT